MGRSLKTLIIENRQKYSKICKIIIQFSPHTLKAQYSNRLPGWIIPEVFCIHSAFTIIPFKRWPHYQSNGVMLTIYF